MIRSANHLVMLVLAFFWLAPGTKAIQASQLPAPTAPSTAAAPSDSDKPHGAVPAELIKSLESKQLKKGDPVVARITAEIHMRDGKTIPRGSKLTGYVTEAEARSKGDSRAALEIVFTKISTPDGNVMVVHGVIQALGPSLTSDAQFDSSPGPGMMAGHEGVGAGTTPPPMANSGQTVQASRPMLNAQSKGVIGIPKLELGENSVLTTTGKEVKLEVGTQMIVQIQLE